MLIAPCFLDQMSRFHTFAEINQLSIKVDDFQYNLFDDDSICCVFRNCRPRALIRRVVSIAGFLFEVTEVARCAVSDPVERYSPSGPVYIPSSVTRITRLCKQCFDGVPSPSGVTFEYNSQVSVIESEAFAGCRELSSIFLPRSLESLGTLSFVRCGLSVVMFEAGSVLSRIEEGVFMDCFSLLLLALPPSLKSFSGSALVRTNWEALITIDESSRFSFFDRYLFNFSGDSLIRSFDLGTTAFVTNSIRSLGPSCFEWTGIEKVIFEPVSIVSVIDHDAFAWCRDLKSICIPRSVECLSEKAFYQCDSLVSVTFESDCRLSVIGASAFLLCVPLLAICIPRSVKTLCRDCFQSCLHLSSVTFESDSELVSIETGAFLGCLRLTSICLPASLEFVTAPFLESGILSIEIDANNRHLSVCNGFLLDFHGERIIQAYGSLDGPHIPRTVKILGDSAFRGSTYLASICIPSNVETIEGRCFLNSNLSSLTFESGSKLAVIEREAFGTCTSLIRCKGLTSFHIPAFVEKIDGSAFRVTTISTITLDPNNRHFSISGSFLLDFEGVSIIRYFGSAAEVRIPNQIQRLCRCCFQWCYSVRRVIFESNSELSVIEESAFEGSSLESISIPATVVALGGKCFSQCHDLRLIAFAAGSKLSDIGNDILDESNNTARIEIPEATLRVCIGGFRDELKRGMVAIAK
jgi:hypothetical protein